MFDRTILKGRLQNSTLEGVERRKCVGIKPVWRVCRSFLLSAE